MNLFYVNIVLSVIYFGEAKPQTDTLYMYSKPHFTPYENYQNGDLQNEIYAGSYPSEFSFNNDGSGNYFFGFNTPYLKRHEVGYLKNAGTDNEIQVVKGKYSEAFVQDDSSIVFRTIGYTADENGYRPFLISIDPAQSTFKTETTIRPPSPPPARPVHGPERKSISPAAVGNIFGEPLG